VSSFFDEDDEPRRPRARRARAGGDVAADHQTVMTRRIVAAVVGVLFVVLLAIAINSCRSSQKKNSLKEYNREVSTIARESAQQVGGQFFQLLGQTTGGQPQDLQSAISSFRVQAEQQRQQAAGLDVPSDMKGAQENLLVALEMRRDGLDYIASRVRSALGDSGDVADQAINQIAGQMQVFLASDVIYGTRVVPFIRSALADNEIGGQPISASRFMPNLSWLNPETVAKALNQQLTSGGGASGQPTGPGLHGTGLQSTAYGDTTLNPDATNRLTYTPGQNFVVTFTNQGENDEFDIKVTVRISAGTQTVTLTTTVPKVAQGQTAEARLPLNKTPPLGSAAEVNVQVAPVPGEKKTDNNRSTYPALFARG
jgi:phosphotransferase system IIB component